jgi:hypothetical protein
MWCKAHMVWVFKLSQTSDLPGFGESIRSSSLHTAAKSVFFLRCAITGTFTQPSGWLANHHHFCYAAALGIHNPRAGAVLALTDEPYLPQ